MRGGRTGSVSKEKDGRFHILEGNDQARPQLLDPNCI